MKIENDYQKFENLFRCYHTDLCRLSYRLIGNRSHAEEIVQELFIDLWNKRERIDFQKSEGAYLRRATTFKTYDFIRKRKSDKLDFLANNEFHVDSVSSPEERVIGEEFQQRVSRAISLLPPKCQIIFKLSRFESLSYREIADHLNLSQKSVEKQISKALIILRKILLTLITLTLYRL